MLTLGINWIWHDTAAAIVDDSGRVLGIYEEERFSRRKHAFDQLPLNAVGACLARAGVRWQDLDTVAVGWDVPRMFDSWGADSRQRLFKLLFGVSPQPGEGPELVFVGHHLAHACSAFYASAFSSAGVLVVDGSGEDDGISIFACEYGKQPLLHRRWSSAFSLGLMYEAATRHLGFGYLDAGKTMGLASYGTASRWLPLGCGTQGRDWDTPPLCLSDSAHPQEVTARWLEYLFQQFGPVGSAASVLHRDDVAVRVASSVQVTTERAMRFLQSETACLTGEQNLCIAGGVALNSVANGQLAEPIYIPPFPHDAGVAVGAAWAVAPPDGPQGPISPYLGHDIKDDPNWDLGSFLARHNLVARDFCPKVVSTLLQGDRVGAIAEGRAEIGPRALGHRSIIASPRNASMRDRLNGLKGRESWRPFAPVAAPGGADHLWRSQGDRQRYMVGNASVSDRALQDLPAAVHVDGTTRPQVLVPGESPVLESLLAQMSEQGQTPALINTSFNAAGEPVVNSGADALASFVRLKLDFLIVEDQLILRR